MNHHNVKSAITIFVWHGFQYAQIHTYGFPAWQQVKIKSGKRGIIQWMKSRFGSCMCSAYSKVHGGRFYYFEPTEDRIKTVKEITNMKPDLKKYSP